MTQLPRAAPPSIAHTTTAAASHRREAASHPCFPPGRREAAGDAGSTRSDTIGQDDRDQCREVVAALAALPRWQRVALAQRRYHGLSYAEIAASLHLSEEGARASVYAALGALRDSLDETAGTHWSRDRDRGRATDD